MVLNKSAWAWAWHVNVLDFEDSWTCTKTNRASQQGARKPLATYCWARFNKSWVHTWTRNKQEERHSSTVLLLLFPTLKKTSGICTQMLKIMLQLRPGDKKLDRSFAHASFISTTTKPLPDSATNTDYVELAKLWLGSQVTCHRARVDLSLESIYWKQKRQCQGSV